MLFVNTTEDIFQKHCTPKNKLLDIKQVQTLDLDNNVHKSLYSAKDCSVWLSHFTKLYNWQNLDISTRDHVFKKSMKWMVTATVLYFPGERRPMTASIAFQNNLWCKCGELLPVRWLKNSPKHTPFTSHFHIPWQEGEEEGKKARAEVLTEWQGQHACIQHCNVSYTRWLSWSLSYKECCRVGSFVYEITSAYCTYGEQSQWFSFDFLLTIICSLYWPSSLPARSCPSNISLHHL